MTTFYTNSHKIYGILLICFCSFLGGSLSAQNTVGVISTSPSVYEGYNLIFPHNQEKIFLLDNTGQLLHYWDDVDGLVPGNGVYILPNGNLVRCKRPDTRDDPIFAGGAGETVDVVAWEGEILHSYTLNNEKARLHHDAAPLPNGNILMIAWEKFSKEEAVEAGRDTALFAQDFLLSEMILEWNPVENRIVWEWHVWNHLVQDKFPTKPNFGNLQQNAGKINLNYDEHDGNPDWLHINSIDYNPVLDQIVLSVPHFNELWVIDHSTTTAEAKTDVGGNAGRGGELLFRFGNDKTYLTQPNEQLLFFQHDVHWVEPNTAEGTANFGKIALFNNRMPDTTSVGVLLNTIKDANQYLIAAENPQSLIEKVYSHPEKPIISYSTGLSSVQLFENGNTLIFSGRFGYAYELNSQGKIVWEYRVPLMAGKPVPQGTIVGINDNITFRMNRYAPDYPGFVGKDLSPKGLLEELEFEAEEPVVTSFENAIEAEEVLVFPNPFKNSLFIEGELNATKFQLITLEGRLVKEGVLSSGMNAIHSESLPQGIYLLKVDTKTFKIIKE